MTNFSPRSSGSPAIASNDATGICGSARERVRTTLLRHRDSAQRGKPGAGVLDELYRQIDKSTLCEARDTLLPPFSTWRSTVISMSCVTTTRICAVTCPLFSSYRSGEKPCGSAAEGINPRHALNARGSQVLPWDAPFQFVPAAWRSILEQDNGTRSRRVWEIALAQAVRDALRSGDLYLAESRRHVSFWHLVYEEPRGSRNAAGPMPNSPSRPAKPRQCSHASSRNLTP